MHPGYTILKAIRNCSCRIVLAWMLLFWFAMANGQNDSSFSAGAISKIKLRNVASGKEIMLNANKHAKSLTLFIFLSPECPMCQNYSGKLNELYKKYGDRVNVYGVFPGRAYSADTIKKFAREYKILFPLLIDYHKELSSYLKASVTPEAIVLNKNSDLVYKGAIDDWAVLPGKQRLNTSRFFLQDALGQSVANETVLIKRTRAVGCRINDY